MFKNFDFQNFDKSFVARCLRGDWYFYCAIIKDILSVCWWWLPFSVLKQMYAVWSVSCGNVGELEERDWSLYWAPWLVEITRDFIGEKRFWFYYILMTTYEVSYLNECANNLKWWIHVSSSKRVVIVFGKYIKFWKFEVVCKRFHHTYTRSLML